MELRKIHSTLENKIIIKLYNEFKLKVEVACFSYGWIPEHILLDRTRNIHSYLVFFKFTKSNIFGRYFTIPEFVENSFLHLLKTQYSNLDRPLFFVGIDEKNNIHWAEGTMIRELFIESEGTRSFREILSDQLSESSFFVKQIIQEL